MQYVTYVDLIGTDFRKNSLLFNLTIIIIGSFFITISAQLAIYLPFSPVPITGQTFAVLLTGILLGSKRGSLAVLLYLFEGFCGLPVFASGNTGIIYLAGPTGGYLLGFLPAAYICGLLAEYGWDRHFFTAILVVLIGNTIIYISGIFWLSRFITSDKLLVLGLFPFIPGEIIKMLLATILLPSGWKLVGKSK
jgi:biotin transport system substrate-specific component